MGDPVTWMVISAGMSAVQGIQGFMQGKANAKAESQANAVNQQNAANQLVIQKQQLQRQQDKTAGTAAVAAGSSGGTLDNFSDLFDDNSRQSLLDQALLEYDNKINVNQMNYESKQRQAGYKQQATSSLISGLTGAASGMGNAYNTKNKLSKAGGRGINNDIGTGTGGLY